MADTAALEKLGWFLSAEGIEECTENGNKTTSVISKAALDCDLKQIGRVCLPEGLNRGKANVLEGPCVLQIQKVRNVTAPKDNEESGGAPPLLKLTLTDGSSNCSAVLLDQIDKLSLDTPPGTKIKLSGKVPMNHGFLLLGRGSAKVLGGHVDHMVENWQLKRTLAKHSRFAEASEGGPPQFVPFGQKAAARPQKEQGPYNRRENFKSLDSKKEQKKEDGEFEQQRQATIAEALKGKGESKPKSFGAGTLVKPSDKDVAQIVDMGFTVENATHALRQNNNNVEQALNSLLSNQQDRPHGRDGPQGRGRGRGQFADRSERGGDKFDRGGERPERGRGRRRDREEENDSASRPSGPATLFDFLNTKIPAKPEPEKLTNKNASSSYDNRESRYNSTNSNPKFTDSKERERKLPPRLAKQHKYMEDSGPPPWKSDLEQKGNDDTYNKRTQNKGQYDSRNRDSNYQNYDSRNKGQDRYRDDRNRDQGNNQNRQNDSYNNRQDGRNSDSKSRQSDSRSYGNDRSFQRQDDKSYRGQNDRTFRDQGEKPYRSQSNKSYSYQDDRSYGKSDRSYGGQSERSHDRSYGGHNDRTSDNQSDRQGRSDKSYNSRGENVSQSYNRDQTKKKKVPTATLR